MADIEQPQIYLISPAMPDLETFPDIAGRILDSTEIACMRLALSSGDEAYIVKCADRLREVCHARDVPLVIDTHLRLVEKLGLDGVHLTDGARSVRTARKDLGKDAIVGAFCATSRHDGMTAGEAGADYVSFGPVGASSLGDGSIADKDLFAWWSETIEVPVVAEGNLTPELAADLAGVVDFLAVGDEIWAAPDPVVALKEMLEF